MASHSKKRNSPKINSIWGCYYAHLLKFKNVVFLLLLYILYIVSVLSATFRRFLPFTRLLLPFCPRHDADGLEPHQVGVLVTTPFLVDDSQVEQSPPPKAGLLARLWVCATCNAGFAPRREKHKQNLQRPKRWWLVLDSVERLA